ncbi:LLM class F420-dependent oxidoreductase [Amnibacterium sp. CER49]|uniref:LLM class F420-dependent oxidoreductase n=1 Tax=Amnibacterium sp. CER49 TaxID=3039161 RepID=UPI00244D15D1|nr:LLM class F420-dependent oxidoreductase [Amnibacterium sp. CER49]MDH2442750.1 LLM class F420-dependent oxidoreductase [Amnibacterium sp. CER49]
MSSAFRPEDRPVRIGVQIAPQHASYPEHRDAVARAEELGADIVFNWDHFFPLSGDPDGLHFEAWTELAAWAEQTERIELGPLVNCNSYRNPNLQADMARTVDHISNGRLIFGTGSGWADRDYREYGYEFGTAGSRLDDLARDLPIIRDRWDRLNPKPVRRIPILIGGEGERKTLRIVAEHADVWHSFVDPDGLQHKLDVLQRHADAVGRDVAGIEIGNELGGRDDATADALFAGGARLFTIGISAPDFEWGEVRRWLAWRDAKNA